MCQARLRHDPICALWMQEHPELITVNSDRDIEFTVNLAFLDDICLV
jgi:hypothetical protein